MLRIVRTNPQIESSVTEEVMDTTGASSEINESQPSEAAKDDTTEEDTDDEVEV